MVEVGFVEREIDEFGRIVLPAAWRKDFPKGISLERIDNEIVIRAKDVNKMKRLKGSLKNPLTDEKDLDALKAAGAMGWKLE